MSTVTWNCLCYNGSDANFRNWGSTLANAIQTVGLVKTSDTGQINWTTVSTPTVVNTASGYEIYRFADSLQATAPCFIKIEYGCSGAKDNPSIWVTIGTGSDGAGNLTGVMSARTQIAANNYNASTTYPNRVSGSTNRLVMCLWLGFSLIFSLERVHDTSGADIADGFLFLYYTQQGSLVGGQYLSSAGSATLYTRWNACLPPTGTGVSGVNTYLFPVRCWNPGETTASLNLAMYFNADLTALNPVSTTNWDGNLVTMVPLGITIANTFYGGTGYLLMRGD